MSNPEVKTDQYGWKYYEQLPQGFRLATIDDFHLKGKKKVGMQYLIQRGDQPYFEIHYLREETRAATLQPFVDFNMVFVKSN